ncbi:MAG: hypothetical protein RL702_2795 [Pseudomonadota bacterium]|jgi:hypothetical protein
MYVASPTRYSRDYRHFPTSEQAFEAAKANARGLRMAAPGISASLIRPESCEIG